MNRLSVIGTAGRGDYKYRMNKDLYSKMVLKAEQYIKSDLKIPFHRIVLVSGGAAWSGNVCDVGFICPVMSF